MIYLKTGCLHEDKDERERRERQAWHYTLVGVLQLLGFLIAWLHLWSGPCVHVQNSFMNSSSSS
jgi:hypothetical protein